jgi:hypothetical protein
MGWRISFGVGPLRYSAPLTSRRRSTRRTYQSTNVEPGYRAPDQVRRDRQVTLIGFAIVVAVIVAVVTIGMLFG